ncbi:hypothetical protein, partial [Enterobacter hormaechei]|uniref:hypothetical protein n=1 Tax=Enterobacter hormaechei TaxID=158836 RepID=UPI00203C0AF0
RPFALVDANLGWQQLLTLLFFLTLNFALVPRAQETVRSRSKAAGRTVRRMDAPTEPYLMKICQRRCREPAWAAVRAWISTIAM